MKTQSKRPLASKKTNTGSSRSKQTRPANPETSPPLASAKGSSSEEHHDARAATTDKVSLFENTTLWWSMLSAVLLPIPILWASFGWIAWLAPIGWLRLINQSKLEGLRPYRTLALTGYIHWLLMTHWVTLPHPATSLGWLALSAYLTIYVVGFIALARWLVHQARWPSVIAAPVSWVTMELLRSHLFTGFALCALSHSQVHYVPLLQIARITGAYGVSFLVMLGAACIERAVYRWRSKQSRPWVPLLLPAAIATIALVGGYRTIQADRIPMSVASNAPNVQVAIIQGSLDTKFDGDISRLDDAFKHYTYLTEEVTSENKIDLVVWPESMFRFDVIRFDEALRNQEPEPGFYSIPEWSEVSNASTAKLVRGFGTKCLLGTSTVHYRKDTVERYNTAGFFDKDGRQIGEYHKMHPVMFGEYIPFGDVFPWLYSITPLPVGLSVGTESKSFEAGGVSFVPCICFENTVPHLIRRQVLETTERGDRADAMVTLTNDGWFWGSALLDLHLACGVYRAVENNLPMLIAANTGFSAHIDRNGRVLQKGPRRAAKVLIANVTKQTEQQPTFYTRFGDLFGLTIVVIGCLGLVIGRVRTT